MLKNLIAVVILLTFFLTSLGPLPEADAQTLIDLPAPGVMVHQSNLFNPLQLKGILVNIKNPLRFDFLVDKGDSHLLGQPLKDEIIRSAKYFLTCLAVPENDLWVNLSPYEKDRIVPGNFGTTLMGKDLLEQDYLLKQIMASMSYPENDLGKRFWQKVYQKSYQLYGTTNIPINTFNKVWIVPKFANVYVQGNAAFVVNSQLDVMLEADYRALLHHQGLSQNAGAYSQVLREVILPELRKEVNEGKNFAIVRQVFNAMILATWYKRHLSDSLLGKMYVGRNYVKGVDISDKQAKEKIFEQYLRAYKKCVYNYIKEDYDPTTQQTVPRKYASGGMYFAGFGKSDSAMYVEVESPQGMAISNHVALATVDVAATDIDGAMVNFPDTRNLVNTSPLSIIREKSHAVAALSLLSRRLVLAFAVLMALGVAAPSAHAVSFKSIDHGNALQVTVGQNDESLDNIIVQANTQANAGYAGPFLGPGGTVEVVQQHMSSEVDAQNVDPGERFIILTKQGINQAVSNGVGSELLAQMPQDPQTLDQSNPAGQQAVEVLAVPTNFKGSFNDGEIDLLWDDATGTKSHVIKRSDNSDDFSPLNGGKGIVGNNYRDMTVEKGHTYRYEIQAVNDKGRSEFSQPVQVSTVAPVLPSAVQPAPATTKPPVVAHPPEVKRTLKVSWNGQDFHGLLPCWVALI